MPSLDPQEEFLVLDVLRSGNWSQGPVVAKFEREIGNLVGAQHAVAVSSGTAALICALYAHGVGVDDEVITSSLAFAAATQALFAVRARPVFVDVQPDSLAIAPQEVRRNLSKRTRAILPVHLFGHPANVVALQEIAQEADVALIHDASQALGASSHRTAIGRVGTACFSFSESQNLSCGEGGMVVTDDEEVAQRCRSLRNHGMIARFDYASFGLNFKLSEIHAALGLAGVAKFHDRQSIRSELAKCYLEQFSGVVLPAPVRDGVHAWHQFAVRVPSPEHKTSRRDLLQAHLAERGIESIVSCRRILPDHEAFRRFGGGNYPIARRAAQEILSLPVHAGVDRSACQRIIAAIGEFEARAGEGIACAS